MRFLKFWKGPIQIAFRVRERMVGDERITSILPYDYVPPMVRDRKC